MFAGVLASMASMKALPSPIPCDPRLELETCDLICNVTLTMRGRQSILPILFFAQDALSSYSGAVTGTGAVSHNSGADVGHVSKESEKHSTE